MISLCNCVYKRWVHSSKAKGVALETISKGYAHTDQLTQERRPQKVKTDWERTMIHASLDEVKAKRKTNQRTNAKGTTRENQIRDHSRGRNSMKRNIWQEGSNENILGTTITLKTGGKGTLKVRENVNVNSETKRIDAKVKIWKEWIDLLRTYAKKSGEFLTFAWEIRAIG